MTRKSKEAAKTSPRHAKTKEPEVSSPRTLRGNKRRRGQISSPSTSPRGRKASAPHTQDSETTTPEAKISDVASPASAEIAAGLPSSASKRRAPATSGYNRIRIEPVQETRAPGSCGEAVVRTLLAKYHPELSPAEEDANQDDNAKASETDDEDANSVDSALPQPSLPAVTHNLEHVESSGFRMVPEGGPVAPALTMQWQENGTMGIPALNRLGMDARVNVVNRRTGRVERGRLVSDLLQMLPVDAALEPILPEDYHGATDPSKPRGRQARSQIGNAGTILRPWVERQATRTNHIPTGEHVVVTRGNLQGVEGILDRTLPGGWVCLQPIDGTLRPKTIVSYEDIQPKSSQAVSLQASSNKPIDKSTTTGTETKTSTRKELDVEAIFMKAVKESLL